MNIYIAARFSRRHEAHALAKELTKRGHHIASRWVRPDADHVLPTGLSREAAAAERRRFAEEDFDDVVAADCMVSLMEEPRNNSRGGRHVEFGMGYVLGHRMIIIGPRETVFHHLREVEHFASIEDFLESLGEVAA